MIQTRQNKPLVYPATTRKQWIEFSLLIGGTSLILAGLSVGLALPTWQLLARAFQQFPSLQARPGTNSGELFLLLIVQTAFSLAAWALLIWIAVREGMRLRAGGSQGENLLAAQPAMPAFAGAPGLNPSLAPTQPGNPPAAQPAMPAFAGVPGFNPSLAPAIVPPTVVQRAPALSYSDAATVLQGRQMLSRVQVTLMPDQPDATKTVVPAQRPTVPAPLTPVIPVAASEQNAPTVRAAHPEWSRPAKGTILPRRVSLSPNEPVSHLQEQPSSPSIQQQTQRRQSNEQEQSDPFAVNENAVKMFLQENSLPITNEQARQKQAPGMPGSEFVFGNPFEGLLPDVFEHDEDLKRSIKEQHLNIYPKSISDQ